jgi:cbb3-type cytochrome oxidase subunit 3
MPLPKGLEFLHAGWWVVHVIAVLLVYAWAYRKGRRDERRDQRARDAQRPANGREQ